MRFLLSVLCGSLLLSSGAARASERVIPPRAAEPWRTAVARIQADFAANPEAPRFAKSGPSQIGFAPGKIAANETAQVDAVLTEWWCSSSGTADEYDRMWMAIVGTAIKNGADAYVYLYSTDGDGAATTLANCKTMLAADQQVDPDAVYWIQGVPTDAFWIRDFGPLFVRDRIGHALSIEDPEYYAGRENDDAQPADFAARIAEPISDLSLGYEGGNFLPNGGGLCIASSVVVGRNPQYSEQELEQLFHDELGCDQLVIVDALEDYATGHVDMWLAFADRTTLLVGEYTDTQDPTNRTIIENNVADKLSGLTDPETGAPIQIVRMPMPSNCPGDPAPQSCPSVSGWNRHWRTYLNVLPINGSVLLPIYARETTYEADAIQLWEDLGFKVVPVKSDAIIPSAGSIHCITKSVDSKPVASPSPTPTSSPTATPTPGATPTPEPTSTPGGPGAEGGETEHGLFACRLGAITPVAPAGLWIAALALGAVLARRRRIG